MKRTIIGMAMLSLLLAGCSTSLPSETSLTKTTSRTLPEREVARRVTAQLADVLLPAKRPEPNPDARNPLSYLTYDMSAHPAYNAAGICLQSYAAFAFAPSGPSEGADTRVRVSSVQTHLQVIVPEKREAYEGVPADDHAEAEKLCDRDRTAPVYARFTADDEYSGIAAFKAFEAFRMALTARPDFPLDCADYSASNTTCRVRLARLTAADIIEGGDCGRDRQKPRPNSCHMLWAGDFFLQIFVDLDGMPQYAMADEQLIMAHTRYD